MKTPALKTRTLTATVALVLLAGGTAAAQQPDNAEAQAAYADMKKTLGLVPTFMKSFPPEAIAAAWDEFKGLQLNPNSALPGKYKELMGLAVAAQVPCRYCIYFHTEAAKLNGADTRELKEAVVMASMVRKWSTILNGQQTDEAAFRQGMDRIFAYAAKPHADQAGGGDRRRQRLPGHRADAGHGAAHVQAVPTGGHRRRLAGVQDHAAQPRTPPSRSSTRS